ncbi:hypothetical protein EYF80_039212 [Liparis tanakae]|uniref:Uncharacterized protein n=1 Tax=Liparis tanakae TaxID=230148 RepID=A0A4Z2GD39_9TELE|nr:hypothetical protein EYF80_039212 [Liparis tanakae]
MRHDNSLCGNQPSSTTWRSPLVETSDKLTDVPERVVFSGRKEDHLPAPRLAAVATEQSQHHQESEGGSRPMETGVTVAMAAELVPQLGQRLASGQAQSHSFLLLQRHEENRDQPQDSRRGARDPEHNPQALKTWTQKAMKPNSSGDLSTSPSNKAWTETLQTDVSVPRRTGHREGSR